jgi:hypothetical protein
MCYRQHAVARDTQGLVAQPILAALFSQTHQQRNSQFPTPIPCIGRTFTHTAAPQLYPLASHVSPTTSTPPALRAHRLQDRCATIRAPRPRAMPREFINRAGIRVAVVLTFIAPLALLFELSHEPVTNPNFIGTSVVLLALLFVARWDLVGYAFPYLLLTAYLIIACVRGGPYTVALACASVLILRCLFRWRNRKDVLDVGFPLKNGVFYVCHGGGSWLLNYHGIFAKSQRYALDTVELNGAGTRAKGLCPRSLNSYRVYGETVYSPCAGLVSAAKDGIPDQTPGAFDKQSPAGNHIWIRVEGSEVYILLAHLQPCSLSVKTGDQVKIGQPIARVGNSGYTSEPHLHIHAQLLGPGRVAPGGKPFQLTFDGKWLVRNSRFRAETKRAAERREASGASLALHDS